jgi:hypothetical protein
MISRLNESKRESDCCLFAAPEARPLHYRPAKTMLVQLRGPCLRHQDAGQTPTDFMVSAKFS